MRTRSPSRSRCRVTRTSLMKQPLVLLASTRVTTAFATNRRAWSRLTPVDGSEAAPATASGPEDLDRLNEGLDLLARVDQALAELVDLHFFAGFSLVDIAGLRGVSERTVQRDWHKARILLFRAVQPDLGDGDAARPPECGPTHAA